MNDFPTLVALYIVFLVITVFAYKKILASKSHWAIVFSLIYLASIYCYYKLLVILNYLLIRNSIYIEFGHANLDLILLMFFCYLNSMVILLIIGYKRSK